DMNGTFTTSCALPDAMLAHLIRPTGAERRSDKAFTLHPTLIANSTLPVCSLFGAYSPFFAA
ncbi:hypothetical protein, partial [Escherichia albertii]|uniref:hypothetical protein n=1 Tax=Escherichia albertii TaxID=208962 RepID=UPI001ED9A5E6